MKKRTQVNIMVKHFADIYYTEGNSVPQVDVTFEDMFPMSENFVFRNENFINSVTSMDEVTNQEVTKLYGKFMIMRNDREQVDTITDSRPLDALDFGVQVNFVDDKQGRNLTDVFGYSSFVYKRTLRSASQFRTAKLLMTEETLVDAVRTHASYGWIDLLEGKEFKTVAKVEPYIGLALSSSVSAGTGYTDVNISDYEAEVDISGALTMVRRNGKNVVVRYDELVKESTNKMELTDGQSLISPKAMAKACRRVEIITRYEYAIILTAYKRGMKFGEQLADATLAKVWAKIPSAIQFRYALKKGLAMLADHPYTDKNGNQFDLVFPDGAVKGEVKEYENVFKNGELTTIHNPGGVTDADVELSICAVSPVKEKNWGVMNYQFIQALDLKWNDIVEMTSRYMKQITKALNSPQDAMAFIGMIDNGDEDEYSERNETQRIRQLLEANPRIFYSQWVQSKIKQLMSKTVAEIKRGRIGVEDSRFVYIVADPAVLMNGGVPLLKKGEAYYNGQVGERALFRSPLVHKSEVVKTTLVTSPELEEAYGHLKNILVLNVADDSMPRMGGADVDGDKVLMVNDTNVLGAVEMDLPMIYGDVETFELTPFVWTDGAKAKIKEYDKNTLVPSQIGTVTNYCTAIADHARSQDTSFEEAENNWELVVLGRILQGKIIDDAKRGTMTQIDKRLMVKSYPSWLGAGKETHPSNSIMGRIERWISNVVTPAFDDKFGALKDYRENILMDFKNYNPIALNKVLDDVQALEASYRQDISDLVQKEGEEPKKSQFLTMEAYKEAIDKRSAKFAELIERHQTLLMSLDAPASIVGLAVLHIGENLQRTSGKAASYPFVVATEYVMALLAELPGNSKLVRVKESDVFSANRVEVVDNTVFAVESEGLKAIKVGTASVEDGTYDVFRAYDKVMLQVEVEAPEVTVQTSEVKSAQFELKGYKKYAGLSDDEVIKLIDSNVISLQRIINDRGVFLGVIFNGQQIGSVGKQTLLDANFLEGQTMKVVKVQPMKGILKITAEVVAGELSPVIEIAPVKEIEPVIESSYYEPSEINYYDYSQMG